ncbi:MAG TPA: hypothetical protein VMF58_12940 [Rhizomicrobium sp.]|nr:hypothetical protein [Rhizomicrobium sp.]
MTKTGTSAVALAALLLGTAAAGADDLPAWCQYALSDAPQNAPAFERYSVPVVHVAHAPRVALGDRRARLYRTQLRDAAKDGATFGPNFAGHYRLASWGCGTGCLNWGLVDLKTGRVAFDKTMFSLENEHIDFSREKADDNYARARRAFYEFGVLLYRPDSALLMTLGTPNEDELRDGMAFYHWTGKTFHRIASIPAIKVCKKPD